MKYKLLVLDVDGTLLNDKKEITPRTHAALLKAQQMGVHVVLASGRPTNGVQPLAEALELNHYGGFILSYNGGQCPDRRIDVRETNRSGHDSLFEPEGEGKRFCYLHVSQGLYPDR